MIKKISRRNHGIIDYSYAALTAILPFAAGFAKEKKARNTALAISGSVLTASLFTNYEVGIVKAIPFKAHLAADIAIGLLAINAPKLFGFHKNKTAREAFFILGLSALLVVANTRTSEPF